MAEKKFKMTDLLLFFAFYITYFTLGRDNVKSFSCILLRFFMQVTNNQFSNKLNDGWIIIQNGRFIAFFHILPE